MFLEQASPVKNDLAPRWIGYKTEVRQTDYTKLSFQSVKENGKGYLQLKKNCRFLSDPIQSIGQT